MRRILAVVCCISLCSMLASAQAASGPSAKDQQFVTFVAQTDMVEVNLGQLAQSASTSSAVKDYAQMLITDHTGNYNQLYTLAHQENLTFPDAISTANNKAMIGPYQKLTGAAFDSRYIHDMIAGHTAAIATFKKEEADTKDPALKAFAEATLPTLQKHLDGAKALQK